MAVLAHHEQDSTHISGAAFTAGITPRWITLEASGFHGQKPDEKRWGIEGGSIDSFATRRSITPAANWSGQVSIGRINNREVSHPLQDTLRTTASVTYVKPLARGHWASSVIWGRNNDLEYTAQPGLVTLPGFRPTRLVTSASSPPRSIGSRPPSAASSPSITSRHNWPPFMGRIPSEFSFFSASGLVRGPNKKPRNAFAPGGFLLGRAFTRTTYGLIRRPV